MKRDLNILLIEDDTIMGESLMERFELEDFQAQWAHSGAEGRKWLARGGFGLVLSDLHLPDMGGDALFREAAANSPALPPWLFITGYGAVDQAVELLKLGAADYLTKPFDLDALVAKLRLYALAAPPAHAVVDPGLGISPALRRIEAQLPQLATQARTVLITGESGVGKEVVARAFHRLAPEGDNAPFIAVNCGAFPEGLLEAELFGHEKGAFTGAVRTRKGVFEQADGGTLFLDEINAMSPGLQAKLLRVLEDRRLRPLGGTGEQALDFRLLSATNRDLERMVEQGEFRRDLYHRIKVLHTRIVPLRERREDIPQLAAHFLQHYARAHGCRARRLSAEALAALTAANWPGNVRELENVIEQAVILCPPGAVEISAAALTGSDKPAPLRRGDGEAKSLAAVEMEHIQAVLASTAGNKAQAARILGIDYKTLLRKLAP